VSNLTIKSPTLFRCFAAMVYDSFILFSILLLATAFALLLNQGQSFLPHQYAFLLYLFFVCGLYLSYCWYKSGQTLGMLVWRIKIIENEGHNLSYSKAWLRYVFALLSLSLLGVGFLWRLFDRQSKFLHDRLLGLIFTEVPARNSQP
jgi:uncharacterized RDD family membrane protein YckC